jgi:hypothetical protein
MKSILFALSLSVGSEIVDPSPAERPARIHELAVDDRGRVYLGENDNHERSSCLWSVILDGTSTAAPRV